MLLIKKGEECRKSKIRKRKGKRKRQKRGKGWRKKRGKKWGRKRVKEEGGRRKRGSWRLTFKGKKGLSISKKRRTARLISSACVHPLPPGLPPAPL